MRNIIYVPAHTCTPATFQCSSEIGALSLKGATSLFNVLPWFSDREEFIMKVVFSDNLKIINHEFVLNIKIQHTALLLAVCIVNQIIRLVAAAVGRP